MWAGQREGWTLLRSTVCGLLMTGCLALACSSDRSNPPPAASCGSNADCDEGSCDLGRRVCVECVGDADCANDGICVSNACQPIITCDSSNDCPSELVCHDGLGRCVDCEADADCEDGEVCDETVCRSACDSDKDCRGDGLLCDTTAGFCVECVAHADCADDEYCRDTTCTPQSCSPGLRECSGDELLTCTESGSGFDAAICDDGCTGSSGDARCTEGAASSGGSSSGGSGGSGAATSSGGSNATGATGGGSAAGGSGASGGSSGDGGAGGASGGTGGSGGSGATGGGGTGGSGGDCSQSVLRLPVTYRDFNADHPDFEPGIPGDGVTGLVQSTLNSQGKPVLASETNDGFIASSASFAEWYTDGSNRATIQSEIVLYNDGTAFANRWGDDGERWLGPVEGQGRWCGNPTDYSDCAEASAAGQCNTPTFDPDVDTCWEIGASVPADAPPRCCTNCYCAGSVTQEVYDGNPLFFPIDNHPDALTPLAQYSEAKIPEQYGYVGTPWEIDVFPDAPLHNFHFTTELRFEFEYDPGRAQVFTFLGDDDLWVFLNGQLAVDLGGWHVPQEGGFTVAAVAEDYGLMPGETYEIAVFHAERQTEGSSFMIRLEGFDLGCE